MALGRFIPKSRRVRVHEAGALQGSSTAAASALSDQFFTDLPSPVFQIDGTRGVTGTFGNTIGYIEDQSGSNNDADGVSPNEPSWTQDGFADDRHAITFPAGSTTFLNVGSSDPLASAELGVVTPSGFSAFVRFKTTENVTTAVQTGINPPMTLVGNHASWAYNNFGLNGGNVEYCWYDDNLASWTSISSNLLELNDGNEHTIAVTHSTTGRITLYVDGNEVVQTRGSSYQSAYYGFSRIGVGYATSDPFVGDISDALVYNQELTDTEVAQVHTYFHGTAPAATADTVSTVLGSRLVKWLRDYKAGIWTDRQGDGRATQITAANQPAVLTTTNGQTYPDFDGNDMLQGAVISTLPAFASSHNRIWGCLIRVDSSGSPQWVYNTDNWNQYVQGDGVLNIAGALSNSSIADGQWRRVIVVRNGTNATTMYINGVAQTTTTTNAFGDDWATGTTHIYGDRGGGGFPLDGALASMFWGYDATSSFTAQDISDLDSALNTYISAPAATYSATATANIAVSQSSRASRAKGASASVVVSTTHAAFARVVPPGKVATASASASVTTTASARRLKNASAQVAVSASSVGQGTSAVYLPTAEPGVLHWHEADSANVTVVGGKVTSWGDDAASGDTARNFTQATSANQPTFNSANASLNNKPSIDFDGTAGPHYLDSGFISGGPYSTVTHYFAVTWNGDVGFLFDRTAAGTQRQFLSNNVSAQLRTLGVNPIGERPRTGEPIIVCTVFSGSTASFYATNPGLLIGSGADTNTFETLRVGASNAGVAGLSGSISAFGTFEGSHDLATRTRIFSYLSYKYLPSDTPAKLYPDFWWRANYPGTSWPSSTPTFNEETLTAGSSPGIGTAKNGYIPAHFTGSNWLAGAPFLNNVDPLSGSLAVYFNAASASAPGSYGSIPALVSDSNNLFALGFSSAGVTFGFRTTDESDDQITIPCSTGAYHLAQAKWDGTNAYLRIDDGEWSSVPRGAIHGVTEFAALRIGRNASTSHYFSGTILEIFGKRRALSNEEFDAYHQYVVDRYTDSFPATTSQTISFQATTGKPLVNRRVTATSSVAIQGAVRAATTYRRSGAVALAATASASAGRVNPRSATTTIAVSASAQAGRPRSATASTSTTFSTAAQARAILVTQRSGTANVVVTTASAARKSYGAYAQPSIVLTTAASKPRLTAAARASANVAVTHAAIPTRVAGVVVTQSISDILGSRLYRWFLDYSTGTWTDAVAGLNATEGDAGQQPSVGTTTQGQSYPDFDGAASPNDDQLLAGAITGLPAHSSGNHYIWGCLLRVDATPEGPGWIIATDSTNQYVNGSSLIQIAGTLSNSTVVDGVWRRVIAVKNGTSGVVTLYVNGVAQTQTSTEAFGSDWRTSTGQTIGTRYGSYRLNGGIASMFFGCDTSSAFSAQDIEDLDAALNAYLEAPVVTAKNATASVTVSLTHAAGAARRRGATASISTAVSTNASAIRARRVTASVSAAISASSHAGTRRRVSSAIQVSLATSSSALRRRPAHAAVAVSLSTASAGTRRRRATALASLSLASTARGVRRFTRTATSAVSVSSSASSRRLRGARSQASLNFVANGLTRALRATFSASTISATTSARARRAANLSANVTASLSTTSRASGLRRARSLQAVQVTASSTARKIRGRTATAAVAITSSSRAVRRYTRSSAASVSFTSTASARRFRRVTTAAAVVVSTSANIRKIARVRATAAINFSFVGRAYRAGVPEATIYVVVNATARAIVRRVAAAAVTAQISATAQSIRLRFATAVAATSFSATSNPRRYRSARSNVEAAISVAARAGRFASRSASASIALSLSVTGRRLAPATASVSKSISSAANAGRFASAVGATQVHFLAAVQGDRSRRASATVSVSVASSCTTQRLRTSSAFVELVISTSARALRRTESSQATQIIFSVVAGASVVRAVRASAATTVSVAGSTTRIKHTNALSNTAVSAVAQGRRFALRTGSISVAVSASATTKRFAATAAGASVVFSSAAHAVKTAVVTASAAISLSTAPATVRFTGETHGRSAASLVSATTSAIPQRRRPAAGFSAAAWSVTAAAKRFRPAAAGSQASIASSARASKIHGARAGVRSEFSAVSARPAANRSVTGSVPINIYFSLAVLISGQANISIGASAQARLAPIETGEDIVTGLINNDPKRPIRPAILWPRKRGSSSSSSSSSSTSTTVSVTLQEVNQASYVGAPIRGFNQLSENAQQTRVYLGKPNAAKAEQSVLVEATLQSVVAAAKEVTVTVEHVTIQKDTVQPSGPVVRMSGPIYRKTSNGNHRT